ncbi:hypothetical protein [Paraburkholderia humisilvae]|uniref:hypothetical protein n=1 Tax=Paraburkholderia humisilvae TaxID=627669 RepID=UPI0015836C4D|nr:hypothetical protein [Paraburkholderia humisilvae]
MIQAEDTKTIPLPLSGVTEKRGRGRPRKDGALTNAQRQAAYRARRKVAGNPVTVTKKIPAAADGYDELVLENERLREKLAGMARKPEAVMVAGAGAVVPKVGSGVVTVTDVLREPPVVARLGSRKLSFSVDDTVRIALDRLAADVGISRRDAFERLVIAADLAVMRSFMDESSFNSYLDRKRNVKSRT